MPSRALQKKRAPSNPQGMGSGNLTGKTTAIFLLSFPAIIYCVLINRYAYNFPFLDDYDTVLDHLLHPLNEQFFNWFAPHNEHHWVLRAAASGDYLLFGSVSFVRLIWLGTVFLLILYGLLLRSGRATGVPWSYLLPVPFILFQPSYWGTMTWATTALHNFPGIVFALTAFILWQSPNQKHKVWATLFLVSALFTHGFGIAACLSVLVWDTLHKRILQAVIPISLILFWILIRINMTATSTPLSFASPNLFASLHFFLNFLGASIHFLGSLGAVLLGSSLLLVCVWLFKKGLPKQAPTLCLFILYLIACAIIVTIARADMGPKQGLASRYRIISTLLLCSVYLGLAQLYWKQWVKTFTVRYLLLASTCLFYTASLYVNINNLQKIRTRLENDCNRWIRNEPIEEFPQPIHAARILEESEAASIFSPRLQ